jgi:type I restriction enzyme S subunit
VDQVSYFNKTVASKDMSGYYLLLNGEYAYNKSYSVGYDFGSIKRLDRYPMGALSTLYICFALKKHDSDFIKAYFDSLKWYREIYMISAEGARNHGLLNVPTDEFFETKHYLPQNLNEQRKIADFIITLERRIDAQQSLVDNLKKYKRGLLMYYFSDDNTRQWMYYSVSQIGKVITGSTPPTNDRSNYDGNLLFCSPGDVGGKKYISSTEKRVSPKGFAFGRPLPPNAVIVTCIGLIGKLGIATTDMITNQQINALVVSEGFDYEFIYYAFENFFPEYRSKVSMQTLPILSKSEFEKLMIKVPILDVQLKISSHLAAMDRRIEHTQQELNALLEQRRGFMQQLFI